MRRLLPALALPLAAAPLLLSPTAAAQEQAPTRVYVVVMDGLRPEEVASMPFLASLARTGSWYQESRAVMIAETLPNHAAMVTGTYADRNGVVANDFPDVTDGTVKGNETVPLESDSIFTSVQKQCPDLTTAAVTSKDYLYTLMEHDRTGDGKRDVDSNFDNASDPAFLPGFGFTPDERTMAEALRVSRADDPDLMLISLGSIDRVGHVDGAGGLTSAIAGENAVPAAREVQLRTTDTQLRALATELQQSGRWDRTALLINADHSMDFSTPDQSVTLSDDIASDPLLAGKFVVAQNGGAALYSLRDRSDPQANARLARLRSIALQLEGVDEVLYRQPNPLDGGTRNWVGQVHPDWRQTGPRSGDLILTVQDGLRVSEPGDFSNPLPGNHGMTSTLRVPVIVNGGLGDDVVRTIPGSDNPFVREAAQAEVVDMAPTAAWLLGVAPPAGGYDGRVLQEAFKDRPAPVCAQAAVAPAPVAGPAAPPAQQPRPAPATDQLPATGPAAATALAAAVALSAAALLRRRNRPCR